MWFQMLFGNTETFALSIAFTDDPHPDAGLPELMVGTWGTIKIWVKGECLTRSVRTDGTISEGVECHLAALLDWLCQNALPVLNEEAFPRPVRDERIASAAAWMDASASPEFAMTTDEEDAWYQKRWEWWQRHALRGALRGVAAPNVFFRRVADLVEVSWDNANWKSARTDITFIHETGAERIAADQVAEVIRTALRTSARCLQERYDAAALVHAIDALDNEQPEQWLVPEGIRAAIHEGGFTERVWPERQRGVLAKHNLATLLLRYAQVATPDVVGALLELLSNSFDPWPERLTELRKPEVPPLRRPWEQGYERALSAREALGLNGQPIQPHVFTSQLGLSVIDAQLPAHLPVTVIVEANRPGIIWNQTPAAQRYIWNEAMMVATGLGHLLMDPFETEYAYAHSATADWPTSARAKAFGAMFLMPADEVQRAVDEQRRPIDTDAVRSLMTQFGTGFHSTVHHLHNLGFLTESDRMELISSARDGTPTSGSRSS